MFEENFNISLQELEYIFYSWVVYNDCDYATQDEDNNWSWE